MSVLDAGERQSLVLLTDLYQFTMAYAAFRTGVADREAVFHLNFRKHPFKGGYTIAAGLAPVLDFLDGFHFTEEDVDYLGSLTDAKDRPLFEKDFLAYLRRLELAVEVDAVPEGTALFPHEPLLRVRGPIIPCMLLETPLLNLINFQTLIATKAARVCDAAQGAPVLEFGLRRAQGMDGALSASRASYIGGCASTSNVLAGKRFGIPVKGTHAHSWVMIFDDELEAFRAYARALPDNCVFLVDTYGTLSGVRHAIEAGKELRARGHELLGIRLDSGDLAYLSIEARKLLDEAGFPKAQILASNELDEHLISSLKGQGAPIGVWGVGTKLVTAYDDAALGGVYKLGAVRQPGGPWKHRVKLSEQLAKVTTPGILQVRRFQNEAGFLADLIYDEERGPGDQTLVDPVDVTRRKHVPPGTAFEDLLVPVFRGGRRVYASPSLAEIRQRTQLQLSKLHPGLKRFLNPHLYPAGLERGLHDYKLELVLRAKENAGRPEAMEESA